MKERVIYLDSRCVNTFVNLIQIAYMYTIAYCTLRLYESQSLCYSDDDSIASKGFCGLVSR